MAAITVYSFGNVYVCTREKKLVVTFRKISDEYYFFEREGKKMNKLITGNVERQRTGRKQEMFTVVSCVNQKLVDNTTKCW